MGTRKEDTVHFTLRIDEELLRKRRHVAKKDRRSVNRELLYLMCKNIEEFEAVHGEILLPEQKTE